jgi:hypothetical protein
VLREHETGPGEPQKVGDRSGHRRGFILKVVGRSAARQIAPKAYRVKDHMRGGFRGRDRERDAATRSGDG